MDNTTVTTPMELWMKFPDMRSTLARLNTIKRRKDGTLCIPCVDCSVSSSDLKERNYVRKGYPFWYQKMRFMLEKSGGDYTFVLDSWREGNSFVCGRDNEKIVSIIESF